MHRRAPDQSRHRILPKAVSAELQTVFGWAHTFFAIPIRKQRAVRLPILHVLLEHGLDESPRQCLGQASLANDPLVSAAAAQVS